jgi:hypothetical protein
MIDTANLLTFTYVEATLVEQIHAVAPMILNRVYWATDFYVERINHAIRFAVSGEVLRNDSVAHYHAYSSRRRLS